MGDNDASKMFSISLHNCSYCLIHSIPIDMKVPLESKSQIFISFSLSVHAGRNEILVLKSNFESLPLFEPSFTQFTPYEQEDLALKV